MVLSRRAFLQATLFASLAALLAPRFTALRPRATGAGVLTHTAGEFLA